MSKIKPYISKYNWEWIEFPVGPKDWEKFEKNNRQFLLMYYIYHPIQKK